MILSEITQTHSDLTIDLKQILQLPATRPGGCRLDLSPVRRSRHTLHSAPLAPKSVFLFRILQLCECLALLPGCGAPGGLQRLCGEAEPRKALPESCGCEFGRLCEAV